MNATNEVKHTPGPWNVGTSHGDASNRGVIIFAKGENKSIAFVSTQSWCSHSESWENARLIAAAPELLEVLQGIMQGIGDGCECLDGEDKGHCFYCMARAALAKATGTPN